MRRSNAITVLATLAVICALGAAQGDFGGVTKIGKSGDLIRGDVVLAQGSNVTITRAGQTFTIAASSGGSGTNFADSAQTDDGRWDFDDYFDASGAIDTTTLASMWHNMIQVWAGKLDEGDTLDVTSLSKSGDTQLQGDVTLSGGTTITLSQAAQDINFAVGTITGANITDGTVYLGDLSAGALEVMDNDSIGGVPVSDYATDAELSSHASTTTGVHGVGGSTVASLADIATPTITSFANATHDHEDAAGGGQLGWAALTTAAQELADADTLGSYAAADYALQTDLPSARSYSLTLEDVVNGEDFSIAFTDRAITISEIRAVVRGTSPSITWTVRHGTDRSGTGAEAVTSGTTTTSTTGSSGTGYSVTSFNDATVVADSFIWFETTAQTGTVDEAHITIIYSED